MQDSRSDVTFAQRAVARYPMPLTREMMYVGLRCLLVLIIANALFLGIRFADNLVAKDTIRAALNAGYANGSMTINSYPDNMLAGWDQGSDCTTAQLAVLGGVDPIHNAIAPRVLTSPQIGSDLRAPPSEPCRDLKLYLDGEFSLTSDITYTRFWQGSASMLAFASAVLPVDGYRALLLNLTLGLIALAAIHAALAGRALLIALAPLLVASFLFDGQIGYAQLISHGPAHVALWLIAVLMIAMRERLTHDRMIVVAVVAGATEAFFDQIISVPLVAGSFLIIAGTILENREPSRSVWQAVRVMAALTAAWGLGFAGSYVFKLLASMALLGEAPFLEFVHQLAFRMGTLDPDLGLTAETQNSHFDMLQRNLTQLAFGVWRLEYVGEHGAAVATFLTLMISIWGWGAALAKWRMSGVEHRSAVLTAGLPYIVAAAILLIWVAAMPEHTYRHAFMVRSFILLLIGGWGWLYAARALVRHEGK